MAIFDKHNKFSFINKQGKVIIPIQYDDAYMLSNGLIEVEKDGKIFTISKKGECGKDCE